MNILPMIAMIILILAIGSSALLQESVSTFWEKRSYLSFMKVERRARAEWEQRQFKKTKSAQKAAVKKNSNPSQSNIPYFSPREKRSLTDLAKLNMTPLFTLTPGSPSSLFLYEATAELLRLLYAKTALFQECPGIEYQLLDAMIAKGRRNEKAASLAELFPDDPKLKEVFYKMAKGTTLEQGYPPLSDYLILEPEEKERALHFNYAPKLLLIALFGEQTAASIIQEEKKKWQQQHKHVALTKAELTTILQKNPPGSLPIAQFDQLFSFSKKKPRERSFLIIDKVTGISTRRKV